MRIESIRLSDFRNYRELELSLGSGTNLFYGDNAQGKTNILEAVYLCGTTRSHRQGKDKDMIRFGCEESHLRMVMNRDEAIYRIDMHLKKNRSKGIAVNGVPIRRAGDLMGLGHFVFFSPEDLNMIKSGPAERRRFIDMELCQLYQSYVSGLASYNRSLVQRNRLLKDGPFNSDFEDMLDLWDEQLIRYGKSIISMREQFVSRLEDIAAKMHSTLTGGREKLRIVYEKNVSEDLFEETLFRDRERDIRMKMTHSGPHRDDLSFYDGDTQIRKYGSQGQQRTVALSLKLSEIEMVRQMRQEMPVLLLDDVLSELDESRQHFLLESIDQTQTLITCTGVESFVKNGFGIQKLFEVRSGTVSDRLQNTVIE